MGVPALTHNTRKTSVGEYVAKIRPAVAEQSRQKKKQTERPVKFKTSPSLACSERRRLTVYIYHHHHHHHHQIVG